MLQRSAIGKIRGNAGRPKGVIADRRMNASRYGAAADHPPGIRLRHWLLGQHHHRQDHPPQETIGGQERPLLWLK